VGKARLEVVGNGGAEARVMRKENGRKERGREV
jgi:hypothetical protein